MIGASHRPRGLVTERRYGVFDIGLSNDLSADIQVLAIRTTIVIEALIWLTDISGLSPEEASATMRRSADALLQSTLQTAAPPAPRPLTQLPEGT